MVPFDPLKDPHLPESCDALYVGGGFPEVFAPALAENRSLLASVRSAVAGGLITWAECGGLLWLCQALDGVPMVGAIPAQGRMTESLTIGYRSAVTQVASPFGPAGLVLKGHEFHRSILEPAGDALNLTGRFGEGEGGYASPTLFASYLHQYIASTPALAESFVATAGRRPLTGG